MVKEGEPFRLVFEVVCSTVDELSYQWFFLANRISGANSHVYVRGGEGEGVWEGGREGRGEGM